MHENQPPIPGDLEPVNDLFNQTTNNNDLLDQQLPSVVMPDSNHHHVDQNSHMIEENPDTDLTFTNQNLGTVENQPTRNEPV
jgi:hypothetical protein